MLYTHIYNINSLTYGNLQICLDLSFVGWLVGCWFVHVYPAELWEMLRCVLLIHYNDL